MRKRRSAALCGIVPLLALATACGAKQDGTATVGSASTPATTPVATSPPTTAPPTGKVTIGELTAVEVDVPQWTTPGEIISEFCPSGRIRLVAADSSIGPDDKKIQVRSVVYTNLDGDATPEAIAWLKCQFGEAYLGKAIAFDRDAGGAVVTLGQVVEGYLWKVQADSGRVTVDISDTMACCSTPKWRELHQTRVYSWTGKAFVQRSGPTAFSSHARPTDLKVTVAGVSWDPVVNGSRGGRITVVVRNAGPYRSNDLVVDSESVPEPARHGPLAVGASFTVTIRVADVFAGNEVVVTAHELGTGGIGDVVPQDNYVIVRPPA